MHRLVGIAFIPNPKNLPCINHKDCNRQNNSVENLEWVSYLQNNTWADRIKKTREKCVNNPKNSKCVAQYLKGKLIAVYPSTAEAERQTGINQGNISLCCLGKRNTAGGFEWKYV